jgi:hypothetical protein
MSRQRNRDLIEINKGGYWMEAWAEATILMLFISVACVVMVGIIFLFGWLASIIGWISWVILGIMIWALIWLALYYWCR